jgi:hypothetical protein
LVRSATARIAFAIPQTRHSSLTRNPILTDCRERTFPDNDKRWDDGPKPHDAIKLKGFGFPGWNASTEIRFGERNGNNLVAGRPQHGVVGINLLAMQDLEFHYEDPAKPRVIVSKYGGSCDAAALKNEGFRLIGQTGVRFPSAPSATSLT